LPNNVGDALEAITKLPVARIVWCHKRIEFSAMFLPSRDLAQFRNIGENEEPTNHLAVGDVRLG
jgi:hypothetical protein